MLCAPQSHSQRFYHRNNIRCRIQITESLIMQFLLASSYSLLGPNILLSTLSTAILNLLSSRILSLTKVYVPIIYIYIYIYIMLGFLMLCSKSNLYQILLSYATHDLAYFPFLRKEINNMRLPCCLCMFSFSFWSRWPMFAKYFMNVIRIEVIYAS
jgi:hypothetical protein